MVGMRNRALGVEARGREWRLWCGGAWGTVLNRVVRDTLEKHLKDLEGVSYVILHWGNRWDGIQGQICSQNVWWAAKPVFWIAGSKWLSQKKKVDVNQRWGRVMQGLGSHCKGLHIYSEKTKNKIKLWFEQRRKLV